MNLIESLIPEPYALLIRVGLIILIVGGAFCGGWIKGEQHEEAKQAAQIIKDQNKTIDIQKTQTVVDATSVNQLQGQIKTLQDSNAAIQKKLAEIAANSLTILTNQNGTTSCALSQEWVDLYNQSVTGATK